MPHVPVEVGRNIRIVAAARQTSQGLSGGDEVLGTTNLGIQPIGGAWLEHLQEFCAGCGRIQPDGPIRRGENGRHPVVGKGSH
jgi:hypothetical protein